MTVRLYSIGKEAIKIISHYVPALAELECRQFPGARHSFHLLAAAVEQFRDVANVQNILAARAHLSSFHNCVSTNTPLHIHWNTVTTSIWSNVVSQRSFFPTFAPDGAEPH